MSRRLTGGRAGPVRRVTGGEIHIGALFRWFQQLMEFDEFWCQQWLKRKPNRPGILRSRRPVVPTRKGEQPGQRPARVDGIEGGGSAVQTFSQAAQARQRRPSARHTCARSPGPPAVRAGLLHLDIRFVAARVSRENERRPIAGRRIGLMHVSLLGWLSPFACALR
jgi:hypothetical protein